MGIFEIFGKNYLHKRGFRLFNEGFKENEQGNYPKALSKFLDSLKLFEKANIDQVQKDELIVGVLFLIAFVRAKLKQFEFAEKDMMKAISLSPQDARLFFRLGSLKLDQGQFENALPIFEKAISLNPSDKDGYFYRGICLIELERFKEAIPDFEKVLKIDPTHVDGLFHLACIYEELKEYKTAVSFYDKIISIDNKDNKAYVNRGNCKIELVEKVEACKDFHRAFELGDSLVQENIDEYCKN